MHGSAAPSNMWKHAAPGLRAAGRARSIQNMNPHAPHFVSSLPPEGASASLRRLGGG
jgi:hypothetical protein